MRSSIRLSALVALMAVLAMALSVQRVSIAQEAGGDTGSDKAAEKLPARTADGAIIGENALSEITIAEGTQWETKAYIRDSKKPGPAVMIVGGVHGRETAGHRAAWQIQSWPITRGKVLVLPHANVTGIASYSRYMSGLPKGTRDLNRHYPSDPKAEPTSELAKSIWKETVNFSPDWLIDLHESQDFAHKTTDKQKYLGNSVIIYPGNETERVAKLMLESANETITDAKHTWVLKKWPIEGSLARAAAARLGAKAMITESSRTDRQPRRERHQRELVHRLLSELEMISDDLSVDTLFAPNSKHDDQLRVAIYNDTGANGAASIEASLDELSDTVYQRICGPALRNGVLDQFDVLVLPGGSGSATANSMGEDGRAIAKSFIEEGGGFMGFCAGAYMAVTHYSWSLGVLDAEVLDTKHWARGTGEVELSLTATGRTFFGTREKVVECFYNNGPILAPGGNDDVPDYEVLASFKTEVTKKGVPGGVMPGTPAIVRGDFGKGRVWVSSPHPEASANKDLREFVRTGAQWCGRVGEDEQEDDQ